MYDIFVVGSRMVYEQQRRERWAKFQEEVDAQSKANKENEKESDNVTNEDQQVG